jgi:hypothetical protein
MAARVEDDLRACTDRLIEIHALKGHAAAEALASVSGALRRDAPVDQRAAAMMGGIVSGALTGLGADLAAGGLTLGGGMLAGALLGALGGAGVAHGINVARDRAQATLTWDESFLDGLAVDVLLRYLAVAHFGRGRGDWRMDTSPALWREHVDGAVAARRSALAAVWARRASAGDAVALETAISGELALIARDVLDRLYPGALRLPKATGTLA